MMTRTLKEHSLPVQIEGFPYIFGGLILAVASAIVFKAFDLSASASWAFAGLAGLFGLFTAFSIWFYRCPDVPVPTDDVQAVLSPANGRVLNVMDVPGTRIGEKSAKKVSIFMSPMDVHVNRSPIAGVIENVQYHKGKFFKADLDKASEENEHNWVVIKSDLGPKIGFVQIAGFIARRIVCYVQPGERLVRGERYGMIRFGSRMEIVVPATSDILVKPGERTVAGVTKLARLKITS
ncbi:MAG: phosphatidylserine decarboxylase family protein [Deltaproteobacteria bacterium]|nr:phosphatidylserine decarboxylase family protein [Deltaproteobacteria bacterium]